MNKTHVGCITASYAQPSCSVLEEKADDSYRRHPAAQDRGTNVLECLVFARDWDLEFCKDAAKACPALFCVSTSGTARGNLEHIKGYSRGWRTGGPIGGLHPSSE